MADETGFVDVEIDLDEDDKGTGEGGTEGEGTREKPTERRRTERQMSDDHDEDDDEDDDDEHANEGGEAGNSEGEQSSDGVQGEADTDAEREAIRERRRQERKDIKARRREKDETFRRELQARDSVINQMRAELDVINRRNTGSEQAQLETAKKEANRIYNHFKDQIRVGTESGNGALVAEATEKMMMAGQRVRDIENIEKSFKQRGQTPPPLDPRIQNAAKTWAEKNKWYDVRGRDADSKIVLTIDRTLAEEGFDPTTPDYWNELDARLKKYLPHRANSARVTPSPKPKSTVAGSGRESSATPNKGTFRLSAERVQAIKDMGAWDDPVARNKMIKQYVSYDKVNGKEGAR